MREFRRSALRRARMCRKTAEKPSAYTCPACARPLLVKVCDLVPAAEEFFPCVTEEDRLFLSQTKEFLRQVMAEGWIGERITCPRCCYLTWMITAPDGEFLAFAPIPRGARG